VLGIGVIDTAAQALTGREKLRIRTPRRSLRRTAVRLIPGVTRFARRSPAARASHALIFSFPASLASRLFQLSVEALIQLSAGAVGTVRGRDDR
jgi:hypothetical protein